VTDFDHFNRGQKTNGAAGSPTNTDSDLAGATKQNRDQ